jgi:hypothetical protein
MCHWKRILGLAVFALASCTQAHAGQFVVFPKAGELASPDGLFMVRNADRQASATDLDGTFHTLWLTEVASGRSRKLFDYVGVAAVGWAANDSLVITEYVGKRTSRALVIPVRDAGDPLMLDKATLTRLVPIDLRPALRGNDHVFVEAWRVEGDAVHLRVWGYGAHDPNGFHWNCEYGLTEGAVTCLDQPASH